MGTWIQKCILKLMHQKCIIKCYLDAEVVEGLVVDSELVEELPLPVDGLDDGGGEHIVRGVHHAVHPYLDTQVSFMFIMFITHTIPPHKEAFSVTINGETWRVVLLCTYFLGTIEQPKQAEQLNFTNQLYRTLALPVFVYKSCLGRMVRSSAAAPPLTFHCV